MNEDSGLAYADYARDRCKGGNQGDCGEAGGTVMPSLLFWQVMTPIAMMLIGLVRIKLLCQLVEAVLKT